MVQHKIVQHSNSAALIVQYEQVQQYSATIK